MQALLLSPQDIAWRDLPAVPPGHGLCCARFHWAQDLRQVQVHVKLPGHVPATQVM
jgi:hypothetical protein